MTTLLESTKLADPDVERAVRNLRDAVRDLQRGTFAGALVIPDVALEDGVAKLVSHGLLRRPRAVIVSVPRGAASAGYIVESRDGVNRTQQLKLTASGYGATITVDLVVL